MTDVVSTNPAAAAGARRPAPVVQGESTSGLTADFQTFLKLLTTQLKAQNPLQPMESTEFVAQLAQFSSVEQQVQTNAKLDDLVASMAETGAGALSEWLGRDVRAAAPARYVGEPITVFPPAPPEGVRDATLLVKDAAGKVVAETPFAPEKGAVTWDGYVQGGVAAQRDALYSFEARWRLEAGTTEVATAESYARVVEARRAENGGVSLVLEGGSEIGADDVSAVRAPR